MSDPAPAPRWPAFVNLALAIIGTIVLTGGVLITFGGWRSDVDKQLADHEKRITAVEITQRADLPTFIGMQKDIAFLVERAREQDMRNQQVRR